MSHTIVFSAVQPSGELTIGNYIGALRQWINMQYLHDCIYCIVDLHAMTSYQDFSKLHVRSMDVLALCLACGIDPNRSTIFVQSHVPEHCQLNWLLNCYAYFGEVRRMTQFKQRIKDNEGGINLGILNYPILMAADILLYQAHQVPIGKDQRQHIELCRSIADRFNSFYGVSVFTVPHPLMSEYGSCIMSLTNPIKKMSKSDKNKDNIIALLDNIAVVKRKIYSAVTDSDRPPLILYDPLRKPGISNLLEILSVFSGRSITSLESLFRDKMYVELKEAVAKELVTFLTFLQNRYYVFRKDEKYLCEILYNGAKKARSLAQKTLKKVYEVMGFLML